MQGPIKKKKGPPKGKGPHAGEKLGRGSGGVSGKGFMPGKSGFEGRHHAKPLNSDLRGDYDKPFPNDPQGRTYGDIFRHGLFMQAISGNGRAIEQLSDRLGGKVSLSITGPEGGPIHATSFNFDNISTEELAKIVDILSKASGNSNPPAGE